MPKPFVERDFYRSVARPSPETAEYQDWLAVRQFLKFLRGADDYSEVILYASLHPNTLLNGVAIPDSSLASVKNSDLLNWGGFHKGWSAEERPGGEIEIAPPSDGLHINGLEDGIPLLYSRFAGARRPEERSYFELPEKVAQILGLHYVRERNAFCRIDTNGEVEEVVRIHKFPKGEVVTIMREDLDLLLLVLAATYALLFKVVHRAVAYSHGSGGTTVVKSEGAMHYKHFIDEGAWGQVLGYRVSRPTRTARIRRRLKGGMPEERRYKSFVAWDPLRGALRECSCNPKMIHQGPGSSDLPYGMTPVFFSSEVLAQYMDYPEKYDVHERQIQCLGAWTLGPYDISASGQVYVYLKDLGDLPYKVQLHWQSFNQPPRSLMSNRSLITDIFGEFAPLSPLESLRQQLKSLAELGLEWWEQKEPELCKRTFFPVTGSQERWETCLLKLWKITVEGFHRAKLLKWATQLGAEASFRDGSIQLIEAILGASAVDQEVIGEITVPLRELNDLRNKVVAHAGEPRAEGLVRAVLDEYGSFLLHFRALVTRCSNAVQLLIGLVGEEILPS